MYISHLADMGLYQFTSSSRNFLFSPSNITFYLSIRLKKDVLCSNLHDSHYKNQVYYYLMCFERFIFSFYEHYVFFLDLIFGRFLIDLQFFLFQRNELFMMWATNFSPILDFVNFNLLVPILILKSFSILKYWQTHEKFKK